jgi:hypothetical protein
LHKELRLRDGSELQVGAASSCLGNLALAVMNEGVELLHAIQDVYLSREVTIA